MSDQDEQCIECGQAMRERGGPCHVTVEMDVGDEYTGGGHSARVRVCATCGNARVTSVLQLTQKQFAANAAAVRGR